MPLLIRQLTLRMGEPEENLRGRIARVLGVSQAAVRAFGIVRRSIDARDHADILKVYHVECAIDADEAKLAQRAKAGQVAVLQPREPAVIERGTAPLPHRPVIIGTGPAGLFAAVVLAEQGYRPLVLERGQDVPARHRALHLYYTQGKFDPENNLLFGIGGAGAYSDGKLYSRTHDSRNASVLELLVRFGADPDILIDARPHMGSDKLPGVCRRIVEHIREQGGEVRYGARMESIELSSEKALTAIVLAGGERIACNVCILAIGHSARDTYRMLHAKGLPMAAKPFQMGVRIEHPQDLINRNQYGNTAGQLPAADYMLVAKNAAGVCGDCGPDLFSFCMCPGGQILPSNESAEEICTNGASNSRRNSSFANSGLVVSIFPAAFGDDPLAGIEYQRKWERLAYQLSGSYAVPAQRATDFLAGKVSDGEMKTSFPLGARPVDLRQMLPAQVIEALARGLPMLNRMIPGYLSSEAIVTAPETRASSPLRILRDEQTRESPGVAGLYPVGEGAGYAGGIVSSATDGMKTAEQVMKKFAAG